jgi:hypothetical protein
VGGAVRSTAKATPGVGWFLAGTGPAVRGTFTSTHHRMLGRVGQRASQGTTPHRSPPMLCMYCMTPNRGRFVLVLIWLYCTRAACSTARPCSTKFTAWVENAVRSAARGHCSVQWRCSARSTLHCTVQRTVAQCGRVAAAAAVREMKNGPLPCRGTRTAVAREFCLSYCEEGR